MKQSGFAFSRTFKTRFGILLFVLAALLAPSALRAQDDYQDPPSRVARLSYIGGNVSFQPAGTDDWIQATWNRPVTTGDQLWTDAGSRAALHIGSASIVLSENTGFAFLNLTDGIAQMQLTSGSARIRVKRLGTDEDFEVDTPNLAFSILQPGIYTISVDPSGQTTVIEDRAGVGQVNDKEVARLKKKNERLEAELAKTRTALDIMGKVHALLEDISKSADTNEHETR